MVVRKDSRYMYPISIIVPAYNAEKTISSTLDHIISQPAFGQCQLILVNDGSNDKTEKICNDYAEKHRNIVVLSQENQGVSAARNNGVRRAEGKFVLFSDADDYYADRFIDERLIEYLEREENFDLFVFNSYLSNRRGRYGRNMIFENGYFQSRRIISWQDTFASIIYRKQFLVDNDVWFDEGIYMNEDFVFLLKAFYQAELVATSSRTCYIYNKTSNSVSSPPFKDYNWVEAWEKGLQWFETHARTLEDLASARFFCGAKIGSRKLFFAKHYLQKGHSKKELIEELKNRGIWEDLQQLPTNQVMPYQINELILFQNNLDQYIRLAKLEGIKIRCGLLLKSIPLVRAIREKKRYPLTKIEGN